MSGAYTDEPTSLDGPLSAVSGCSTCGDTGIDPSWERYLGPGQRKPCPDCSPRCCTCGDTGQVQDDAGVWGPCPNGC